MSKKIDFNKLKKHLEISCSTDPGQEIPQQFIRNLFENEVISKNVKANCKEVVPLFGLEQATKLIFIFALEMGLSLANEDIYEDKKERVH